jgi:phosphoribosylformylglycinamidine synthase PurS subunit
VAVAEPEGPAHRVEVRVELKPEVADAEAESVARSLGLLGIGSLRGVHIARLFELEFVGVSEEEAERRARDAVERLLANPVIHRVAIRPLVGGAR